MVLCAGTLALALALTGCAPAAQLTSPSAAGRSPLDWPQPKQDSDTDWYQDWLDSWQGTSPLTEEQRPQPGNPGHRRGLDRSPVRNLQHPGGHRL